MAGVELSGKLHVQIGIVNLKNKCGDNDGKKTDVCVVCVVFFLYRTIGSHQKIYSLPLHSSLFLISD